MPEAPRTAVMASATGVKSNFGLLDKACVPAVRMTLASGSPPPKKLKRLSSQFSITATKAGTCNPKVDRADPSGFRIGSKKLK